MRTKKEVVLNDDWKNARYRIGILDSNGRELEGELLNYAPRFNEAPPADVWIDRRKRETWIAEHAIYPYKYVDVELPE